MGHSVGTTGKTKRLPSSIKDAPWYWMARALERPKSWKGQVRNTGRC